MSGKQHYLYRLLPPRPEFPSDMTPEEAAVMQEHGDYWDGLLDRGVAVVFGPVAEPTGTWGLGVLEVDHADEVDRIRAGDPAVRSGVATAEVHPMISAYLRPSIR
ncbi:hypothetical protein GCU56_01385 [Geodermatophilus sabuli]|uniref:YCII-related domain-containing protein n=1 Tax=Geodermatophilus sabuli TaxID=1564158 RepID=A0A7K3VY24_9ACTN|nr:YciI family protein [Geodermatophilus sabuli]NEK56527.1 hypothetical protein [Geodermatophilus sabuli]